MANKSVLELAVGTGQWDSGLKKAKQALDNFTSAQGGLQQALDKDNGDMAKFVQMMTNMDSAAKTSKQQLREMTNVLTDFTTTYRTLTDEQKASPFGQEMAKAIQSLTERAGVLRDAMEDVQQSIRNAASDTRLFDQVAQGMSVATAGFQGLTGAGKLLGIEMGNDVEVIAKLQAAMAVTNSLTTIQTALQKQSALMQGVQAVQASAAAAAQTALAAATGNATLAQKAFNVVANMNPYVALATAIVACGAALYAFSSNSKNAEQAQKSLNLELEHTKNALSQIDKDTDFSVAIAEASGKSWKAIHDLRLEAARTKLQLADMNYDKLAASGNASAEQMKQAAEMQKQAWDGVMKVLNEGTIHDIQKRNGTGPFAKSKSGSNGGIRQEDTNYAADSIMAQEKEVQRLTDAWRRASGAMRDGVLKDLDAAKQKLEEMEKVPTAEIGEVVVKGDKMKSVNNAFDKSPVNFDSINTYISGVKDLLKNADLGSDLYNSLTEKLKDATTMSSLLQELMDRGLSGTDLQAQAQSLKEKLLSPDGIDQGALQKWLESLNEKIKEAGGVPLALNMETGEVSDQKNEDKQENQWKKFEEGTNKMVSGLSQVSSGLKGIGIEVPKEVDQIIGVVSSIMQVIQGVETVISVLQFGSTNANTVALAANTAALWAVAATNILPFAGGGIVPAFAQGGVIGHAAMGLKVPGSSFSGDNLRLPVVGGGQIAVNSGELILNRAQQGVLADALSQGGAEGMELQTKVSAEEIIFVLNNNGKRRGIGNLIEG